MSAETHNLASQVHMVLYDPSTLSLTLETTISFSHMLIQPYLKCVIVRWLSSGNELHILTTPSFKILLNALMDLLVTYL